MGPQTNPEHTGPPIGDATTFARGALAGLLGRGMGFGIQYLFLAGVGRFLGADRAAPFYTILAVATTLAVIGRAGLDRFGLREIAAGVAAERGGIVRPLVRRLLSIQAALGALLISLVFALESWIRGVLSLGEEPIATQLAVLIAGLILTVSLAEYVLAFRWVFSSALVKSIVPYGLGACLLCVFYVRAPAIVAPRHAAASLSAGMTLALIIGAAIIVRNTAGAGRAAADELPRLELARSVSLAAVPLLMLGMTGLDVVLLQAADPGAQTSFYQAAQRTSMTLTLGLLAINGIAAPMIAAAFATRRMDDLEQIVRRSSRWSLAQATLIATFLVLFGRWVLSLFGPDFELGYRMLLVLVAAQIINSGCGPVVQLFIMTGKERTAFAVLLPVVLIALPCYYLMGRVWGGLGVALVTTAAFAAWNGALVGLARRRFRVWSYADNWSCSMVFLLGAILLALFETSGGLSLWAGLYVLATAIGLWGLCIGKEDRRLIRRVLPGAQLRGQPTP